MVAASQVIATVPSHCSPASTTLLPQEAGAVVLAAPPAPANPESGEDEQATERSARNATAAIAQVRLEPTGPSLKNVRVAACHFIVKFLQPCIVDVGAA